MFDALDINLTIPMGIATPVHLENLKSAIGSEFEMIEGGKTGAKMLRVIIASHKVHFETIDDLEEAIRKFAPEIKFPWQRFGGVRVGSKVTVVL